MNNTQSQKEIRIRGYIASVFTVISLLITLIFFIMTVSSGKSESLGEIIVAGLILGFVLGGTIPGITHIKEIFNKIKKLLYIFPIGWAIFLVLILAVPYLGGWIFMFMDLVNFLKFRKEGKSI